MQCPACHNEVGPQAAFCNHCGSPIAAAPTAPAPAAPAQGYTPVQPTPSAYSAPSAGYSEVPPSPPAYAAPAGGYAEVPPAYTPPAAAAPAPGYAQTPGYAETPGYAQTPPAYPATPVAAPTPGAASGGLSPNSAAALSYITVIPAIIFLVMEPYNKIPFVKFHSLQSIGLAVSWFALWIILVIAMFVLHFIPVIGTMLGFLSIFLYPLLGLGFFILWVITVIKASKGEWFKIPVIGNFALKQAQS